MTIKQLIDKITTDILNPAIIALFALATLAFAWGIATYLFGISNSPEQASKGKSAMLWGLIGMTIMASAWGIVRILCGFFGVTECL